jgi:hypothetical protein
MEYVRSALPVAVNLWGPEDATALLHLTGRMIGMQFYHETARALGVGQDSSALQFGRFMVALAQAQGDTCQLSETAEGVRVTQHGWNLMDAVADANPCVAQAWNGLLEGALDAHNHRLALRMNTQAGAQGREFSWLIARASA